jgi:5,10-methylenetetrahydrofolate reductase
MVQGGNDDQAVAMTPEKAQVIVELFRIRHPSASAEIGQLVDSVIHGAGDDVPEVDWAAGHSGASVSPQAAQAAVEFVMAALLMASR